MKKKLILTGDFGIQDVYEGKKLVAVEIEGDFEVEEIDLGTYVRVEFLGGGGSAPYLYTYQDIGLDLEVGDLVDVPTKYEEHNIAQVKALGRGAYKGDPAPVLARYVRKDAGVEW